MTRRQFLGGGMSAAALVGLGAGPQFGNVIPGEETWSESLMLLHFDPEVRNGVSIRVSRYPDKNVTWVWCHVLFEGRLYAFTERRLPCSTVRNVGTADQGDYASLSAGLDFVRHGPVDRLDRIELIADVPSRLGGHGPDGSGRTPVRVEAVFRPTSRKKNTPAGRSEWTGRAEIGLSVGGRLASLSGPAKAHEQTQTSPRFDAPFTYAMMWSPGASFIANASLARRYGDYEVDGRVHAVKDFRPDPPAHERAFSVLLDDGRLLKGVASRVAAYEVPVFNRVWRGNIVRVDLDGRRLVGMLNDWRPEDMVPSQPLRGA